VFRDCDGTGKCKRKRESNIPGTYNVVTVLDSIGLTGASWTAAITDILFEITFRISRPVNQTEYGLWKKDFVILRESTAFLLQRPRNAKKDSAKIILTLPWM
jgi:hypothetical protein